MAVEWSGLGPHLLLLSLDRERAVPLRTQLEEQLRDAIRTGRLAAGERLPSSRVLASSLGLSRGLIQDCYAQLQAEGFVVGQLGSATRVADGAAAPGSAVTSRPASAGVERLAVDFASGVPDLGLVPRDDWAWAVREVCRTAANAAFDYGDPGGVPRLREVLAAYLRRVRAVDAGADRVIVCNGHAQGLALVLVALARQGLTRIAYENPGSRRRISGAAALAGGTVVPVPVDEAGIDVGALAASGARIVTVTPAHQWPTGVVLAPRRRQQLVAWAREHDGFIIEDDYDSEFRYDRDPIGALQGLAPDRVITLGTVSKSLAPALRLGWAVVPPGLIGAVTDAKSVADRGTSGIDQLALATLIESGRYDRHLRRTRTEYARRRDVLVESLPAVRLTGLAAGFHAVAHLPDGVGEREVVEGARKRGVGLYGMSLFRADRDVSPAQLVLGFGNTSQADIRTGIASIADLLVIHS